MSYRRKAVDVQAWQVQPDTRYCDLPEWAKERVGCFLGTTPDGDKACVNDMRFISDDGTLIFIHAGDWFVLEGDLPDFYHRAVFEKKFENVEGQPT